MIPAPLKASLGSEPGGVFYLYGDDEFRKEEAVRSLVDAHLDPGTADFNHDRLRGSETSHEQIASILGTPPMMAEWRVVVLRETEALAGSPRARDQLLAVAASPPEGLALILSCSVPAGSSARFYRDLAKLGRSMEFRPVEGSDLPVWLMERARSAHGMELAEDAARALAQGIGADLGLLESELRKFAGMVDPGGKVTLAEVEAAGTMIPRQDRWGWFDLVAERKTTPALRGLRVLLDHGESGVGLVIGLATHFLRLGLVRSGGTAALERSLPPRQGWLARKYGTQAHGWSVEELRQAIEGLLLVDRLLKSSGFSDSHLLEAWLVERDVNREAA
ncbi:MAG: DNA polymerase III subunit delta [Gemmatimonadales bacterium]|nr:MAG: DNA polymerase III subunit delta [Gemmatimonadales bacterium]